jgi:hypothetical protein
MGAKELKYVSGEEKKNFYTGPKPRQIKNLLKYLFSRKILTFLEN